MPRCPNPRCQADYPAGTTQCSNPFCQCMLPESVIAGRYRIETLIGMGGMGAVYRASDTFELKQVALKVLTLVNSSGNKETALERFRREARYAHQLRHKNIVPVLNFGQDGDLLYLEMPLITGGTLKGLLKTEHPLPSRLTLRYVNDLAAAIDAIHTHPQEIVHRDIKPANLLIHQDDGRLVLTDFGIARAMLQEKALTQRGWSLGTEHYIAPEQEQGKAQPASDIYALGVVTYQMFTGLLPFQAVVRSHATELPPPSTFNAGLPPEADACILRALDIDPAKRFSTAKAFAQALNDALLHASSHTTTNNVAKLTTQSANTIIRIITPINPCGYCGRENRSNSHFCRYCGHNLDATMPILQDPGHIGYTSDRGRKADNEDMVFVARGLCTTLAPPPGSFDLFAVADGLRGPQDKNTGGHEASKLAVETIADMLVPLLTSHTHSTLHSTPVNSAAVLSRRKQLDQFPGTIVAPSSVLEHSLCDAVRQANRVIYHCNADYGTTMASTLAVALQYKYRLYVASVGDSHAYHYVASTRTLHLLNPHQGAEDLSKADTIIPGKLFLNRYYLGSAYQVSIDEAQRNVSPGDLVLLCTDGLWHAINEERMKVILSLSNEPQDLLQKLMEAANAAGGEGNKSAVLLRVT